MIRNILERKQKIKQSQYLDTLTTNCIHAFIVIQQILDYEIEKKNWHREKPDHCTRVINKR